MNRIRNRVVIDALKYSAAFIPLTYIGFFLDAGITSYSASITGRFFNAVLRNQQGTTQELLGTMLMTLLVGIVALPVLALGTNIIIFFYGLRHEFSVTRTFFKKSFAQMNGLSGGEVVQRLFRDPNELRMLLTIVPANVLAQMSAFAFMVVLMVRISPTLSLVCVSLGILGAVLPLLFMRKLARLDEAKKNFDDRTAGIELEMIENRGFFQSYGLEDFPAAKQDQLFRDFDQDSLRRGVRTEGAASFLPECCLLIGNLAFLLLGLRYAQPSAVGAGDLVAFFTYLTIATGIVTKLYNQSRQMARLPKSIDRILSVVDHVEKENGAPVGEWKTVRARDLTFSYEEDGPAILYPDFDIARNDLIEIRGANGTGKTTLVRLLCGLLSPKEGEIQVDGHGIGEINPSKWRDGLTCVEQIPAVFEGTLRENIRIGNLDASPERLNAVLTRLRLIDQAEREIATAQQLSGGELKKVSLGRALLRDGNIVIFDEPFEHLDAYGQQIVREMLADDGKTRLCIQHRSSGAVSAEKFILL